MISTADLRSTACGYLCGYAMEIALKARIYRTQTNGAIFQATGAVTAFYQVDTAADLPMTVGSGVLIQCVKDGSKIHARIRKFGVAAT